jgi:hypothetical protein
MIEANFWTGHPSAFFRSQTAERQRKNPNCGENGGNAPGVVNRELETWMRKR